MTWNEFKAEVDKQLEENGIDPNTDIWYIDCSSPDMAHAQSEVCAGLDKDCGIAIQ